MSANSNGTVSDPRRAKAGLPTGDVPAPTCRMIIRQVVRAEVIYIGFPRVQRALLVDLRRGAAAVPSLTVMPLDLIPEHQVATMRRLCPVPVPPGAFASVVWGGSLRAFTEQGVLPAILNRLPAEAMPEALAAIQQLWDAERTPAVRASSARRPIEPAHADGDS